MHVNKIYFNSSDGKVLGNWFVYDARLYKTTNYVCLINKSILPYIYIQQSNIDTEGMGMGV